jgi:CheY-specific phosphatase CheX
VSITVVIEDVVAAMIESLEEIASVALGWEAGQDYSDDTCPDGPGAYIALIGDEENFEVGVTSTDAGCRVVVAALLGMEPEDELTDGDIADALGEIVNMLGGGIKSRMSGDGPHLKLGLPMFVGGPVYQSAHQVKIVVPMRMGPIGAQLVVLSKRGS